MLTQARGGLEYLVHELLDIGRVNPGSAQAHLDFRSVQVPGLDGLERLHILGKEGVLLRDHLRGTEFPAHVAGEILVRRLPALVPVFALFVKVKGAGSRIFEDDAG